MYVGSRFATRTAPSATRHSLLKFDLGLAGDPERAQVLAARLYLTHDASTTSNPKTVGVYQARAWGAGVSWNSASSGVPWQTPGGDWTGTRITTGSTADGSFDGMDVTAAVKAWAEGTVANHGFLLRDDNPTVKNMLSFFATTVPQTYWPTRPRLEITYHNRPVYHAEQWTGDPSSGGELIAEEWAVHGLKIARRETADAINTRTNVPCEDGAASGPKCAEVRLRTLESQFEGADPNDPEDRDTFTQERGVSEDDPNIPQIAELLDPAGVDASGEVPVATGPLGDVLQSWQVPPPGHGSTYAAYEATARMPFNAGVPDPATREYPEEVAYGTLTFRVTVDTATKMPIRVTVTGDDAPFSMHWSYDPTLRNIGDFPPDFFLVAPPEDAALSQSVTYHGSEQPAEVSDPSTETAFTPYTFGNRQTVGGRPLCLITSLVFKQSERSYSDVRSGPAAGHDLSSLHRVDALYGPRPADGICRPGTGSIDDSIVTVSSLARSNGFAYAFRDSVIPRAEAQIAPPSPDERLGGVDAMVPAAGPDVAYVAPAHGGGRLVLADIGTTTVLIDGEFPPDEADNLLRDLEAR